MLLCRCALPRHLTVLRPRLEKRPFGAHNSGKTAGLSYGDDVEPWRSMA